VSDYTADRLPEDFDSGALYDELKRIEDAMRGRQSFSLANLDALGVEPAKPQEYDIVAADGDNWNPGSGSGLYVYLNGTWEPLVTNAQQTAFGEASVAQPRPVVQLQFPYAINPEIVETRTNNGAVTVDANRAKLSTGAGANQLAQMLSRAPIKYNPGQGGLVRFTGVFTTGVANSQQLIGIGDSGDGYFFGYNGADFGVMRRSGGNPEVREFQVTTASTTAEDITITLDGDANTVTVTNSANVTTTANEIAADAGWGNLGSGWKAVADGDTVVFESFDAAAHDGAYSITATSAAGTYSQTLDSTAPTDSWVTQANWSDDQGDNTKHLPTMDWTKGNVFQIRYQWLGYGLISFYVEHAADGDWVLVHKMAYANANTLPSVQNPTLPLCAMVANTSNTSDIVLYTSSMAGFSEGLEAPAPVSHGTQATLSIDTAVEVPIISLHCRHLFQSKLNRTRAKLTYVSVTNESGKPAVVHFDVNTTLRDAAFTNLETATSIIATDTAATKTTGGDNQFSVALPSGTVQVIPLVLLNFFIHPGDTMTISGAQTSGGTASVVTVSLNFEEHF